ncbi:MAG: DUF4350 domain-containing protein [Firmicutes bacterium]|jgi:hypothetical protein|nr:DUF4350 domain-containing protein [Bacillota bacterium]
MKPVRVFGLFLAAVLAAYFTFGYAAAIRERLTLYHPESSGQYGYKGVSLLLHNAGYTVKRVEDFSPETRGPVICFTGNFVFPEEKERILAWVESGGTIVEMTDSLPRLLPFDPEYEITATGWEGAVAGRPLFSRLKYYPMSGSVFTLRRPEGGLYHIDGNYLIYSHRYGEGAVITWADPKGLINKHLKRYPDNAVIFTLLIQEFAPGGELFFLNMPTRAQSGNRAFLTSALQRFHPHRGGNALLFLAGILTFGKATARLGRPRPLPEQTGRSYEEFLDSLAELFYQAGAGYFILERLLADLLAEAAAVTKLPPGTAPDLLAESLVRITGGDFRRLPEIAGKIAKAGAETGGKGKKAGRRRRGNRHQLFADALCLERYREELEAWKKSKLWWQR